MKNSKIDVKDMEEFARIANRMSPENLCGDGELSRAQANVRARALTAQWTALERKAGRKVSMEEVEGFLVGCRGDVKRRRIG